MYVGVHNFLQYRLYTLPTGGSISCEHITLQFKKGDGYFVIIIYYSLSLVIYFQRSGMFIRSVSVTMPMLTGMDVS